MINTVRITHLVQLSIIERILCTLLFYIFFISEFGAIFIFLHENLGRDWRQLARRLHISDIDIEAIANNSRHDLKDQALKAMYLWKRRGGQFATKQVLIEALRKCKLIYIAECIETMK